MAGEENKLRRISARLNATNLQSHVQNNFEKASF